MKKILGIIILVVSLFYNVNAQSGKWTIKFKAGLYNGVGEDAQSDHSYLDVFYRLNTNSNYIHIYQWGEKVGIGSRQWVYLSPDANVYPLTTSITGIMLNSKLAVGGNDPDDKDDRDIYVDYQSLTNGLVGYKSTHFCETVCDDGYFSQHLFRGYDGYIDLYVFPSDVQIAYKTSEDNFLTSEDKVSILAPSGYTTDTYKWVYFSQSANQWMPFYNMNLQGKQAIDISAEDVYGPNYNDSIMRYKNTSIALQFYVYDEIKGPKSIGHSNILTLANTLSATHISALSYDMETCHDGHDGKLRVYFDRELYAGEKLYVSASGNRFVEGTSQLAEGKRMVEFTGLAADTFRISLIGTYQIGTAGGTVVNTYTDGIHHRDSVIIPQRPALVFSSANLTQSAVHCYGGKDGKIFVKASGGVGEYDAYLFYKSLPIDTIRFKEGETGIFDGLKADDYLVSVKDTNGCVWDKDGNEVKGSITVTEPSSRVKITNTQSQEVTGYGLSDGWAQIRFEGGTSGEYSVVWTDNAGNAIPHSEENDASSRLSKAENLKSGKYRVTVTDVNYSSASPTTYENTCGCTDTAYITVEQPPKLLVTLAEHHYVTCYGDQDGAIVAHATGGRPFLSGLPYKYEWIKTENGTDVVLPQTDSIARQLYSGYYKLRVTDRNNISTTSDVFYLVQPDPLAVSTKVIRNIACSGDSEGIIEATATGGTPPYTYIWSTNETTRTISKLPQGNYVVAVRDARYKENIMGHYCIAQAVDSIQAPNPIKLNAVVKNPVCNGSNNGEINIKPTGGVPPYRYEWTDGVTLPNRTGLAAGQYRLRASDSNGCFLEQAFTLSDPLPLTVDLGKDIILCKGQTLTLDGKINLPNISYQWMDADGSVLASTSALSISKAGKYRLKISNSDGCEGLDEILVSACDYVVEPDFVIASRVANNKNIFAVNIMRSQVDSVRWSLPSGADVIEKNDDYAELSFPSNGDYVVGMTAYRGGCSSSVYKTVSVVDAGDIQGDQVSEPFLKRFVVTPNPNNGQFEVTVELREPASYSLQLYDPSGKLVETKNISDKIYEATTFSNTGLGSGVYLLRFVSSQAISVFKVVIN